jgi:hypothetical protein
MRRDSKVTLPGRLSLCIPLISGRKGDHCGSSTHPELWSGAAGRSTDTRR